MTRLLASIFLLASFISHSQRDFRFRNYTISDGLSQSSVTCIVQDEQNSLWFGTQEGLNRFDGKSFEIFNSTNTEELVNEYITCAVKNADGSIWFGSNNGLIYYDKKSDDFEVFSPTDKQSFQVRDISLNDQGDIWIATAENGIYLFTHKNKKFKASNKGIRSKKVTQVLAIKNVVIVSTEDEGLFIIDKNKGTTSKVKIPGGDEEVIVNKLIQESSNEVTLATNSGIYELHLDERKCEVKFPEFRNLTGKTSIADLIYYHNLGWVVATKSEGLYVLYDNGTINHIIEDIFQKGALLNDNLNTIFKDNSGTIWIGSQRGVTGFDPLNKGFLGVGPSGNESTGLPSPTVWSFEEDENQRYIFIGTDKGVSRYDRKRGSFKQFYRNLTGSTIDESSVLVIKYVRPGKLLVGCADGLYQLNYDENGYRFQEINLEGGLSHHKRAYSILHWKGNQYFIATKGGVLLFDESTENIKTFEHNPTSPKETITKGICRLAVRDENGRIWFTTSTGGLNVLKETEGQLVISPYSLNHKIKAVSDVYITSIYAAKNGDYWFGTFGSGLIKWNEKSKKSKVYDKKKGLPNDVVYGILSDDKGNLWLSTNKGICSFNRSTGKSRNFSEIHGLLTDEFNIGAHLKAQDGEMFFGGIYGYNHFFPKDLKIRNRDLDVTFTKFKLENEWLKPGKKGSPLKDPLFLTKEINLSYRQRSFTIRFQSSVMNEPGQVNYKYILEGSEEPEILIGTDNEIRFNALSPGSYTLKVYARVGEGPWSLSPASIQINIAAPFWATWWFWGIVVVVVFLVVRFTIKRRTDTARREQIRLEMKIRDRTKEIQKKNIKIEQQNKRIEEERNKVLQQQKLLQKEKDKTEQLLKNVIPESTAEELKKKGKARARAYKKVSVLFTDFVGFTHVADELNPTELVKKLDVYFTRFDEIIIRNNLEKIKTIGDAYMCAGGVPVRNNTNPMDTVLAALQIQHYMKQRKNDAIANSQDYWELRLGINTGEVTAGVIGSERLAYDIWGATVNQAQRMEMLGEPGKVTITGGTFDLIEPYFECSFKGKAQSKSRGLIDMYVVERIKPELSEKGEGIYPNDRFHQIINLHLYSSINYYKAERHIMRLLEKHLSKQLHYHSIAHTKDVVNAVERLALLENVTDEGLFLLKSAATYHDAGFIEQYDKNEPVGARLAEEILPKYGYTGKHIDRIKDLIFVTQIPHKPQNHLEEIMCDADLDYLGRDDFHEISDRLRQELIDHGKVENHRQWDEIQISFFKLHKYFTKTAKDTRNKKKAKNLKEIKARLKEGVYTDGS